MATTAPLHCSVITPEQQVLDADATAVVMPAHDGLIGILHNRAPLLTELGTGVLRVDTTDQGPREFFIDGGFGQVLNNEITILTERAAPAESITAADAQKALHEAEAMPAHDDASSALRRRAIERARAQLAIAKK